MVGATLQPLKESEPVALVVGQAVKCTGHHRRDIRGCALGELSFFGMQERMIKDGS